MGRSIGAGTKVSRNEPGTETGTVGTANHLLRPRTSAPLWGWRGAGGAVGKGSVVGTRPRGPKKKIGGNQAENLIAGIRNQAR